MAPFTRRIAQLRAQLPGGITSYSPLSPRELEVARLVARGLTNKQIGQALYVSERTAENHVQHILTKLGFKYPQPDRRLVQRARDGGVGPRMSTQVSGSPDGRSLFCP